MANKIFKYKKEKRSCLMELILRYLKESHFTEYQNAHSFPTYLAEAQKILKNTVTQAAPEEIHLFPAKKMFTFRTVCSMIARVVHEEVLFHAKTALQSECSLKKQRSQHARQRTTTEEGFTSVRANVLFPTHVVLTVHRRVQAAQMDSMPAYQQRKTHHPKMKLMKQQLQEARRRVKIHIMYCVLIIVILYVHQLT